jgi:flagellar basal body-associated protein FliL
MYNSTLILLICIVAVLTVAVIVLTFFNIHNQQQMQKKNDAIIREMRENMQLRDELHCRLRYGAG